MNRFHTPYYRKYFKSITLNKNARILDIGCGGGSFLHYLNKRDSSFQLHGLDHSEEMISLASKKNRIAINKKQLELHIGSVSKLNLDNNSLDMITAFETIQFWPDHELAFHEIYRTLDNNGEFLVINRYPKEGTKWWDYAKLKTDKEYESALLKAHFQNVSTDLRSRKGWIIVRATKNDPLKTPEI
jgi:ubiquinone/menaquinone biosynthesis C-methylase UbiE